MKAAGFRLLEIDIDTFWTGPVVVARSDDDALRIAAAAGPDVPLQEWRHRSGRYRVIGPVEPEEGAVGA